MKWLSCVFAVVIIALTVHFASGVSHAVRYTICDQCGLCTNANPVPGDPPTVQHIPSNWGDCAKCLYTGVDPADPISNVNPVDPAIIGSWPTILIDETVNVPAPPTPQPGHYYTGLGCFTTDLGDFSRPGAAAALARPLLNVILSFGGGVAFLYLMYGAFLVVTSRGDPEQLSQGRRTIYGSVIGIVFALSSVFLINLLANGLLRIPGFQ